MKNKQGNCIGKISAGRSDRPLVSVAAVVACGPIGDKRRLDGTSLLADARRGKTGFFCLAYLRPVNVVVNAFFWLRDTKAGKGPDVGPPNNKGSEHADARTGFLSFP